MSCVTAPLEDWQRFLAPQGPVRVEHADGTLVAYGARGRAQAVGDVAEVRAPADIELVLFDETGATIRAFPGSVVIEFREQEGPVDVVVVADSVEPDPGDSVITRG